MYHVLLFLAAFVPILMAARIEPSERGNSKESVPPKIKAVLKQFGLFVLFVVSLMLFFKSMSFSPAHSFGAALFATAINIFSIGMAYMSTLFLIFTIGELIETTRLWIIQFPIVQDQLYDYPKFTHPQGEIKWKDFFQILFSESVTLE